MRRALIIVDVQPTFCEGGELPVQGGNAVAEAIARYVREHRDDYHLVVTTQDWHIDPGTHFSGEPDYVDTWPVHGVAGSVNAQLHPALSDLDPDDSVYKGQYEDGYSGFDGTTGGYTGFDGRTYGHMTLLEVLNEDEITDLDVVGLAESHCVKHTALDAVRYGFKTRVLLNLTAPVTPELGAAAEGEMLEAGVELVTG